MTAIPFVPFTNCASIELVHEVQGQRCENVFCVNNVLPITAEILADMALTFKTWYAAYGKQLTYPGNKLSLIIAKDLTSQTATAIEYSDGLPIDGTLSDLNPAPLNVTAAVSFGTAMRGRSYRGRIYQIGMGASQFEGNHLRDAAQTALIAAYGELVSACGLAGYDLCVASRWHNKAIRSAGVATRIISVNVDLNMDSQRRRLTGRGQ